MKKIKFEDEQEIPVIGFGTYELSGQEAYESTFKALEVGYRHIDTADRYGNHKEVRKAIENSGIKRDQFFLTSKVWYTDLRHQDVLESTKRFLEELNTDYLNLLLVHYPNRDIPYEETFTALEKLKQEKLIISYGVSNFMINHIADVIDEGYLPVVNQIEYHPTLTQPDLKRYCYKNNIKITAYSPLAQGQDLKEEVIIELANKYDKSEAQVILRWVMQKGMIVIPRSSNPDHIKENLDVLDWELETDDINRIDELDRDNRVINPSFADFDY